MAEELRPDVVCLDVRMPVMDGVAAAGPLAQRSKVLMLSYSEDEHLVTGAIRNGAAGYLVHGRFEPEELEGRIKAVARGEMVLSPAVTPAVFDVLRRAPGVANDEDELGLGSLTAREREVLNLLARGNTNREIAEQLVHHQQDGEEPPQPHLREDRGALALRGDRALAGRERLLDRTCNGRRSTVSSSSTRSAAPGSRSCSSTPASVADFFAPLMEQPALAGRYRVVRYHRAGYAGSDRVEGPLSFAGRPRTAGR